MIPFQITKLNQPLFQKFVYKIQINFIEDEEIQNNLFQAASFLLMGIWTHLLWNVDFTHTVHQHYTLREKLWRSLENHSYLQQLVLYRWQPYEQ